MWWRPAWFSLKGKIGIRGQRRGAVLPHSALSTNRPADPCTTASCPSILSSPRRLVVGFCCAYDELRNFLRPRSRLHQHVPADCQRLLLLRRSVTVLAILQAAEPGSASFSSSGDTGWREP